MYVYAAVTYKYFAYMYMYVHAFTIYVATYICVL